MRLGALRLVVLGIGVVSAGMFALSAFPAGAETFEGRLVTSHSDDFMRGRADFQYQLVTADGTYELRFSEARPALPLAATVRVHGARGGNVIAVSAGGIQAAGDATVAATTGAKTVAVILFDFSDNTSQPYTPTAARGIAFDNANSVANYYAENSWGKLTLSGDVFGWYTIPDTSASCNYSAWASSANAAATAAGVNLGVYTYKVYAFPSVSSCGWSGLAFLPGTQSWLNGSGGMSLRVMSHELGHNFGTHHASSFSCTDGGGARVSFSASCTASEYGDPFTVMGAASARHHANFSRGNFGWLTAANTQDVLTSGTYSLHAAEPNDPTGVQALRIRRDSSTYLLLELRQPYGSYFDNFSSSDPAVTGVSIRIVPGYTSMTQSKLIDATPATTSFGDAPLGAAKSVFDPVSGITITTQSVSSSGATVQITFAPDTSAPTAPANLTATPLDSTRISLSWQASTDNTAVSGYRIYRGGSLLTTTPSTSYTDTGLTPGTPYSYNVVAFDGAGNTSAQSNTATATTPTPDTQAPTAPGNLTATRTPKPPRVNLSWTASTDNVGVAGYRVYRNGALLATVTGTSYSDRSKVATGTSYYVVAYDAAGNTSAPSNTRTV